MAPRPDERADNGFGEEEPIRIPCLDAGDPDVRGHADDPDPIRRRSDDARGVRTVAVVVVSGCRSRHRCTRQTVSAVGAIDVLPEVWMPVVQSGVDIADQDRRAAACDGVRLWRLDLPHVPLKGGESVGVCCRRVRQVTRGWSGCVGTRSLVIVEPCCEGSRGRGAFDPVVLDNIRAEVAAIGASDRDTDLAVAVDQRAASLRDTGRRVGGYRRAAIEHDVVLHRAGLGGDG